MEEQQEILIHLISIQQLKELYMFQCSQINPFELPTSLKEIGESCFENCFEMCKCEKF